MWERFCVPHLWAGLLLLAICWPLNWRLPQELRPASYLFFPLWLGYTLTVDAFVLVRSGTSLLQRSPREFALLFVASAPAWWIFEAINRRTQNWQYLGTSDYSSIQYAALATISFSTVMPAVFETAELVRSCRWLERLGPWVKLRPCRSLLAGMFLAGVIMAVLSLLWPRYFYPLVWGAVFLLVEPINVLLSRHSFFDWLQEGDWRPVLALSFGALGCGFFWEMWNYYSFPKWIYHTPGAEFLHVFEMPLLGYLGYLPFAWELFALRNLIWPTRSRLNL